MAATLSLAVAWAIPKPLTNRRPLRRKTRLGTGTGLIPVERLGVRDRLDSVAERAMQHRGAALEVDELGGQHVVVGGFGHSLARTIEAGHRDARTLTGEVGEHRERE